jgi:hypothetical protein
MTAPLHRRLLAALAGAGVALTGATAAVAAPATPRLSATSTNVTYGQPNLYGQRSGTNTITITNRGQTAVEHPVVIVPPNDRDHWTMDGVPGGCRIEADDTIVCVTSRLAPGATRDLTFGWVTLRHGRAGSARATVAETANSGGVPLPGTARSVRWRVGFAPITGTFDITATPLRFGAPGEFGARRGTTEVTVTNLTAETVEFPVVKFPTDFAAAKTELWEDCRTIYMDEGLVGCVPQPIAPGARRTMRFTFDLEEPYPVNSVQVWVEATTDLYGHVIPGTAAGDELMLVQ